MSNITTSVNANHIADDGQIHSLPHQKYGPYTCPRCNKVFLKSQSFAAHVPSHYKDESEEERMRRLLLKTKKRKPSSQMVNNQSTAVLGNANRRPTHRHAPMAIKEEKVEQDLDQVQRTTLSTLDHSKDHLGPPQSVVDYIRNILGPPPGFEGHHINDNPSHPPGFEGRPHCGDAKIKSEPFT